MLVSTEKTPAGGQDVCRASSIAVFVIARFPVYILVPFAALVVVERFVLDLPVTIFDLQIIVGD